MNEERILNELEEIKHLALLSAKKVLNIQDCATLTGLSVSHLYKLTCRKQIPYYKPNNKFLYFDRAEIEAWMKQGRVGTEEEIETMAATYVATGKMSKMV